MTNATVESATKLTDEFDKWQAELTSLLSDLAHKDGADGARAEGLGQFLPTLRAAIAALQAEPQPAIPKGWVFSSADFSLQASGASDSGSVMLVRGGMARVGWHQLTEAQKESIPLYVSGTGKTIAQAIANAVKNCTPLRLPATPPKD